MLQVRDNTIQESLTVGNVQCYPNYVPTETTGIYQQPYQVSYWNSYPVYICTDKTKKAIEIIKVLQSEKLLECKSVNKFIDLVEKISNLL